jgi:L-threonylcarbamoyladenylate synthase
VDGATAGLATVGLRAPAQELTLQVIRVFGKPIAGPSANRSNHVSPTTAQHVRDELGAAVDMILDGSPFTVGIESTMPDMTTPNVLADARTTFPINGVSLTPTTGYVRGTRRIRQTCRVRAGKIPAVHMLATAAVALLEPHADLVLGEHSSFMIPRASAPILEGPAAFHPAGNGLISFHYEPDPVLHP